MIAWKEFLNGLALERAPTGSVESNDKTWLRGP